MTVIAVLTASLLMALIFVPVLGGLIGKRQSVQMAVSATAPRFYRAVLKFAIRRPAIVMIAVIGCMGAPMQPITAIITIAGRRIANFSTAR